jgi:hypothetical protein
MRLLHEDGLVKVRQGLTTIEEIARVVGFTEDSGLRCANCSKPLPADFRFCAGCGVAVPQSGERQQLSLTAAASHGGTMQTKLSYVV